MTVNPVSYWYPSWKRLSEVVLAARRLIATGIG